MASSEQDKRRISILDTLEPSFYDQLYNQTVIKNLAGPGKQPLTYILSKHFRVMFLDGDSQAVQRLHLVNFLYK